MSNPFMQKAIDLALENVTRGRGGPFGAVIVKNGEIIATGVNRVTSTNDPVAHAEIIAIRAACKFLDDFQLHGCTLYTSCEPCPMCLGAIYWARLERVYYAASRDEAGRVGFDDALIYEELKAAPAMRAIPMYSLMHDEAQTVFDAWLRQEDRISY